MEYIWTENTKRNTIWTVGGEKEKRHEDEEKKRGWKNRNVFSFVSLQTGCGFGWGMNQWDKFV